MKPHLHIPDPGEQLALSAGSGDTVTCSCGATVNGGEIMRVEGVKRCENCQPEPEPAGEGYFARLRIKP